MAQITNAQRHQIAYLGAVLLEAPGYRDSVMRLSPAMFEPGILEDVFSAVYRLVFAGKGVDPITVADQAAAAAQNAEDIRRTIFRWAETCPSVSHLEDYESLLYEDYRQRLLAETLAKLQTAQLSADAACTKLRNALAVQDNLAGIQLQGSAQEFDAVLSRAVGKLTAPDTALKTSWRSVDRFGLFERGNAVVLAGRPGCGKTDFAINLAARLSRKYRVYYLTLEESDTKMMHRIISRTARIDAAKMRDKRLSREELAIVQNVAAALHQHHNMVLEDCTKAGSVTIEGVRARLLRHKPDIAFVDHIGLIAPTNPKDDEYKRLSDITRQLKMLAMQLDIVIVELCQLNRSVAKSGDAYATLADLRGSGTIEQDANAVMMMRTLTPGGDELHDTDDYRDSGIMVAKNREGGLGEIKMQWRPQYHDWLPAGDIYPQDEGGEAGPQFEQTNF